MMYANDARVVASGRRFRVLGGPPIYRVLAGLYLAHSFLWLLVGRLNEDEGWYLEAARRVYAGQLPYRDFSFTQMPLVPYIYGLPLRLFGGGLWTGRAMATLLGAGALVCVMLAASRLAGHRAAVLAGLLLATNAYAVAYFAMVKTYAPAAFLLMAAILAYTADTVAWWRAPLTLTFATGAALTRLSFVPVAAILAVALIIESGDWHRRRIALGATLFAAALLVLPALSDPAAFRFNAIDYPLVNQASYHLARRDIAAGQPPLVALQTFLAVKVPLVGAIAARWGAAAPLLAAGGIALAHARFGRVSILAATLAAGLIAQLPGAPYVEYAVPFMPLVALLGGIVLARASEGLPGGLIARWRAPLLAGIVIAGLATVDTERVVPGVPLPVRQLDHAAAIIRAHAPPGAPILTFDTYLAIQADRPVPTWLAMSHYSYYRSLPEADAARFHVVSDAGLRRELVDAPPAALLAVTDTTFTIFAPPGPGQPSIRTLVEGRYRLAATIPRFGQWEDTLYLYVPRDP